MPQRLLRVLLLVLFAVTFQGCSSTSEEAPTAPSEKASASSSQQPAASDSAAEEPETLLASPSSAPPLAELDAKAEWEDQPVRDSLELFAPSDEPKKNRWPQSKKL